MGMPGKMPGRNVREGVCGGVVWVRRGCCYSPGHFPGHFHLAKSKSVSPSYALSMWSKLWHTAADNITIVEGIFC